MDGEFGFGTRQFHMLVDCIQNSNNQYVVRETLFEDFEPLAKHLNDEKDIAEAHLSDGQQLASPRAMFIFGTNETVSKFLQSIGIAQHIVSRYCRLEQDTWEDYVRALASEEYSFFSAKWGATSETGFEDVGFWTDEPSEVDVISMSLEHFRRNSSHEDRFKRPRELLCDRRRTDVRRVARLQATSVLSTTHFLVIWAEPLTLIGRTTDMTNSRPYNILGEISDRIRARDYAAPTAMCNKIVTELHRIIVLRERETLRHMQLAFDDIDAEMTDNDMLYGNIAEWRRLMGLWKPYLHSRERFAEDYGEILRTRCASTNAAMPAEKDIDEIKNSLEAFVITLGKTISHCDSTFNSCVGTYNGIESQKAIYEAEQITKLTQLAFFFIPLTFVTGFFGMNLKVHPPCSRVEYF